MVSEHTEEERAILLMQLRTQLKRARADFKDLNFGYEVTDAVSELISFTEFELDEMEVEYDDY